MFPTTADRRTAQPPEALLTRTVRLCVNPDGSSDGANGYAGRPAMRGLGRYYELTATVRGVPDPRTGYVISIHDVDDPIRASVTPAIERACRERPTAEPAGLMTELWDLAAAALPARLERLAWALTPTYKVEMSVSDRSSGRVVIRQRFDFAASHRLHSPALTDDENRRVFGKCNNPGGHGHNYRIEAAVSVPAGPDPFPLAALEQAVEEAVLAPFDHKHLNTDTPEFDTARGGVTPSVEHIAMVCHARLAGPVRALREGAELAEVTVWETDRTSCTYPAHAPA